MLVLSVLTIVPLVSFNPLRTLRITSETALPLTASFMVPEIVPVLAHVSGNCFTVATVSSSLSVASVVDWVVSRYPLFEYVRV